MRTLFSRLTFLLAGLLIQTASAADPSGRYLPVKESLARFALPEGYFMEAALTEPAIAEPVDIVFDGNGRMFVAEMRSYMQDVDGTDQDAPVSRISLHEDRDGDGTFDTHSIFLDGLVMPRMMLPLRKGELLVNETHTHDIFLYKDTDGDGVSDSKTPWYVGGPRGGNMEHQQSGLIWALDNWIYMTINAWRLRWDGYGKPPLKEKTPPNGGQWGLSQDDNGKLWFINAGGEIGPLNFQQPIIYGRFSVPGELSEDFRTVYPLPTLPDMQAGTRQMRPEDGTLNHFTSTCGGEVFRGDRLPKGMRGDLFFSEPVGRIVRQARVEVRDGLTYLSNAYPGSEFIRTRDPNFRAVNLKTAPDGTLYLVDMHRGIIQEGAWVGEGSYLRRVVDKYDLDKNILHGRIYRLRHRGFERGGQPRMFEESSAELVQHLAHPNGWWRDTAQRLLILQGDRSVQGALEAMANSQASPFARMHALWTLEGLGVLEDKVVLQALVDGDPQVRANALRVADALIARQGKNPKLHQGIVEQERDVKHPTVAIQAMLSDQRTGIPNWKARIGNAAKEHSSKGVQLMADMILNPERPRAKVAGLSEADEKRIERGEAIYNELCFACHGPDGRGMKPDGAPKGFTLAPPFAGSATLLGHSDVPIAVLLKGLTGPVNGKTYEAQMVPMENNDDEWIASVVTFIRTHFGNRASTVTASQVAKLRAELKQRGASFTQAELRTSFPQVIKDRSKWKVSASHYEISVDKAIDKNGGSRWDTQESQQPGMWYQVELPEVTRIAGVLMDTGRRFESGFPRELEITVSTNGRDWQVAGHGSGDSTLTEIRFPPIDAKFVRLTLTQADHQFWIVGDLQIFHAPEHAIAIKAAKKSAGFE